MLHTHEINLLPGKTCTISGLHRAIYLFNANPHLVWYIAYSLRRCWLWLQEAKFMSVWNGVIKNFLQPLKIEYSAICICKIGGHFSTPFSSPIQLSSSSVNRSGNCSPFTLRRLWYCFFFCIISSSAVSFTGTDSCSASKANAVSSSLVPVVFRPQCRKNSFSCGTFHLLKSSNVLFSGERTNISSKIH